MYKTETEMTDGAEEPRSYLQLPRGDNGRRGEHEICARFERGERWEKKVPFVWNASRDSAARRWIYPMIY